MTKFKISYILLTIFSFACVFSKVNAQEKTPESIAHRFFMPALQMGYINHNSENVSSGLVIQTSIEYRAKKNWLLRLNYDDFSGRVNLKTGVNQTYNARIPISDLIGGFGYRLTKNRNNYFLLAQAGVRFYENPIIENTNGSLNIKQTGSTTTSARYTFGYEYEIFENVYLNSELFFGHILNKKEIWTTSKPFYGATIGISARLF